MAWLHLTSHHYCRPTNLGGIYDLRVNISWRHLVIAWKVLASVVLRMPPLLSGTRSPSPSSVPSPLTFSRAIWRHVCLISHIHNCDVTFLSYFGAIENWHYYYHYYYYYIINGFNSRVICSLDTIFLRFSPVNTQFLVHIIDPLYHSMHGCITEITDKRVYRILYFNGFSSVGSDEERTPLSRSGSWLWIFWLLTYNRICSKVLSLCLPLVWWREDQLWSPF